MVTSPSHTLTLLAVLLACPACAQNEVPPRAQAQMECSVATDVTCAVRGLEPQDAVELAQSLFQHHNAGELDLERLVQRHLPELMEIAPPLLLSGALLAIEEVAPEIVAEHRATVLEPTSPSERAVYVGSLLGTFVAADVSLSDRPIQTLGEDGSKSMTSQPALSSIVPRL